MSLKKYTIYFKIPESLDPELERSILIEDDLDDTCHCFDLDGNTVDLNFSNGWHDVKDTLASWYPTSITDDGYISTDWCDGHPVHIIKIREVC